MTVLAVAEKDQAGRPALAVSWQVSTGKVGSFFLDPASYTYLGRDELGARVGYGIVDAIGQKP